MLMASTAITAEGVCAPECGARCHRFFCCGLLPGLLLTSVDRRPAFRLGAAAFDEVLRPVQRRILLAEF
jgi:hypothetical protein